MKRTHLFTVLVLLLALVSCSKSCSGVNDDKLRGMIPKDATMVIAVRADRMLDQLQLKGEGLPEAWKDIIGEKKLEVLNDFFKNIDESGVDLEVSTYMFLVKPEKDTAKGKKHVIGEDGDIIDVERSVPRPEVTMLVPLTDEDKVIAFIEKRADAKFEKSEGMKVAKFRDMAAVVRDKVLVLFSTDKDVEKRANALYERKAEDSLLKNEDALKCFEESKDAIVAYINAKNSGDVGGIKGFPFLNNLTALGVFTDFESNEMKVKVKFYGLDEELGEMMNKILGEPTRVFFGEVPDGKAVAVANVSLNGKAITELPIVKMALDSFTKSGDGSDIEKELGMSLVDIISSIDGISVALANDFDVEHTAFVFSLRTPNAKKLLALLKKMLQDGQVDANDGIGLVNGNVVINYGDMKLAVDADERQLYGKMLTPDTKMIEPSQVETLFSFDPMALFAWAKFDDMTCSATFKPIFSESSLFFSMKVETPDGKLPLKEYYKLIQAVDAISKQPAKNAEPAEN